MWIWRQNHLIFRTNLALLLWIKQFKYIIPRMGKNPSVSALELAPIPSWSAVNPPLAHWLRKSDLDHLCFWCQRRLLQSYSFSWLSSIFQCTFSISSPMTTQLKIFLSISSRKFPWGTSVKQRMHAARWITWLIRMFLSLAAQTSQSFLIWNT